LSALSQHSDVKIRPAREGDIPDLLEMIRELAEFEKLSHQVSATELDYREHLFGQDPAAEALIAEAGGKPVGYALFFRTFSTFLGRPGLWLEDLYVKPGYRKNGIGKQFLLRGAEMARSRHAGRYEWCVLDWNQNAIEFYQKAGGNILEEWRIVRMEENDIKLLSENRDSGNC